MKILYTLILTAAMTFPVSAQLTVTRADVESRIDATEGTNHQATNAEGMTFDLNGPVYDMTVFQTEEESISAVYMDPSLTPYPHEFPTATHSQVMTEDDSEGYVYMRLDDNGLYLLGFGGEMEGSDFVLKYSPERPALKFPFQKGSSWSYKSDVMTPIEGFERVEESEVEAIAEGTLRTPQGDYPCIVSREWLRITSKISFGGQVISESYTTNISFTFLTKNGVDASITIDTLDAESMTPTLIDASWTVTGTQTSAHAAPSAMDLHIASAYPNPANGGALSVDWNTGTIGNARLDIVDALGRVHRVLHEGSAQPGRHSARTVLTGMPAGMYFIRLMQGTKVATRPLTVVH